MTGLIISGMHHSGTSVVSRLLANGGWNAGMQLLPDDPITGKHFYEDSDFVALNRGWLSSSNSKRDDPSDWGVSKGSAARALFPADAVVAARAYVTQRERSGRHWFAKDPRSSLTLDVWRQIPELRFLVIYRNPWDVVESLMRYGHPFTGRPDWAFSVWKSYNERVLESICELGPRVMVVAAGSVLASPHDFLRRFSAWTGVRLLETRPENSIDEALFRDRPEGSHISQVFRTLHPEVTEILNRLDGVAELPRKRIPQKPSVVVAGGGSGTDQAIQVIIPCRNDGQFLQESISSVEETASAASVPVELTLVDGASDDDVTVNYLRRLSAVGYQTIRAKKLGPSAARNAGLRMSEARAIIPLDADNQLLPGAMAGALKIVSDEADVVYGPWRRYGLDNAIVSPPEEIAWSSFVPHNTIDVCAPISRRLLERLGGWNERILGYEDWDLWIRAFQQRARFHRTSDIMFDYCVRPGSMLAEIYKSPDNGLSVVAKVVNRHLRRVKKMGVDVSGWE